MFKQVPHVLNIFPVIVYVFPVFVIAMRVDPTELLLFPSAYTVEPVRYLPLCVQLESLYPAFYREAIVEPAGTVR